MDYQDFEKKTKVASSLTIGMFYSENKTNSTDPILEMFEEIHDKYRNMVVFKKLNCDRVIDGRMAEEVKQCLDNYSDNLPNLKYYFPQESAYFPYHPTKFRSAYADRKVESIQDFEETLVEFMPIFAWRIGSLEDYYKFEKEVSVINRTIFFASSEDQQDLPAYFKGLSSYFKDRLEFAYVLPNATEVLENFGIEVTPRWIVMKKNGAVGFDVRRYLGKRRFEDLKAYLAVFAEKKRISR